MKSIALVGNPNSGKSTLFNSLTGSSQFVGNWPGVTVEKKEGKLHINKEAFKITDLPGIYSLSPYSNEEIISRDFIINEKPDVVIDIVDASNLERNLYLTTQLLELGVPVLVALNMIDVVKKKGEKIDTDALAKELGCPVCEISAINNKGVKELKAVLYDMLKEDAKAPEHSFRYAEDVQNALNEIKQNPDFAMHVDASADFVALKVLTGEVTSLGGEDLSDSLTAQVNVAKEKLEAAYDDDLESIITEQRYEWIKSIIDHVIVEKRKEKISLSDKIDKVLTNKWIGLPIFLAIIYGIYFVCLDPKGLGKWLVGKTFGAVFSVIGWAGEGLKAIGAAEWLQSLICEGVLFGIGIVIAFIPYLMILYIFLAILEECGYMARVAFIMDRLFRRFGLSGKSFVPMLLGTGCSVQAIAASRTIENESDRRMTIFLTPFMPCATKMPAITLVISVFTDAAWIAPLVYILAIVFIILGGIFLKKTSLRGEPAPFVMELPEYKLPRIKNILHFVWDKTVSFFRKVSTIIFISTIVIWVLKYFSFTFQHVEIENSMLANIGKFLSPIFAPLGFGSWELIAAMVTGYVAKDNVLATLGIIFGAEANALGGMAGPLANAHLLANPVAGISFILFFILSSPCFASIGAMRTELGSAKLTAKAVAFQMGTAYIVSLAFNILGNVVLNLIQMIG